MQYDVAMLVATRPLDQLIREPERCLGTSLNM
jgi:hypothetical protein